MEGFRIIGEAFDTGSVIKTLIYAPYLLKNEYGLSLLAKGENLGIEILELSEPVFRSISLKENPQGLAAIGWKTRCSLAEVSVQPGVFFALNEIADPGNLGTIIRTADAVDVRAIFLLGDCVNPYETAAIRGSMGAIFSQKIVTMGFQQLLNWKTSNAIPLVGTSDRAETDFAVIDYPNPVILLMGSERQGLTSEQLAACDQVVRIPMLRSSDSLNLAVATGVMAYQIYNSHRGIYRSKVD